MFYFIPLIMSVASIALWFASIDILLNKSLPGGIAFSTFASVFTLLTYVLFIAAREHRKG